MESGNTPQTKVSYAWGIQGALLPKLPWECVAKIVLYLPFSTILKLERVNKRWKQFLENEFVWSRLCVRDMLWMSLKQLEAEKFPNYTWKKFYQINSIFSQFDGFSLLLVLESAELHYDCDYKSNEVQSNNPNQFLFFINYR